MKQYLDVMQRIIDDGVRQENRTGIDTLSLFGVQMRFDLRNDSFPLLTTKRMPLKAIVAELIWFLNGGTNIRWLQENGVHIWDEWADEAGSVGPIYGHQWRNFGASQAGYDAYNGYNWSDNGIDQISDLVNGIKSNPASRRHIVTAWNPYDIKWAEEHVLPPCHLLFQFYVNQQTREISCQLYQRSADWFLGVPFNIASYALLTKLVAQATGYTPGEFIWTGGDCHLYVNHLDQAREQLSRSPLLLPTLTINPEVRDIDLFTLLDFDLHDYQSHPAIKAEVAV